MCVVYMLRLQVPCVAACVAACASIMTQRRKAHAHEEMRTSVEEILDSVLLSIAYRIYIYIYYIHITSHGQVQWSKDLMVHGERERERDRDVSLVARITFVCMCVCSSRSPV